MTTSIAALPRSFVAKLDTRLVDLRYIPDSVSMIMTLCQAFWRETNHIYPNRLLVTEKFAVALCRELAHAFGVRLAGVGKPIIKPGTTVFNMRVHIVPDDSMSLPAEVSFAQELELPGYMDGYMTDDQAMLARFERNGFRAYDFSGTVLEGKEKQ